MDMQEIQTFHLRIGLHCQVFNGTNKMITTSLLYTRHEPLPHEHLLGGHGAPVLHILDLQSKSLYGENEAPLIQHSGIFVSICSVFTSAPAADRRAVMVVTAQGRLLWQKKPKVSK